MAQGNPMVERTEKKWLEIIGELPEDVAEIKNQIDKLNHNCAAGLSSIKVVALDVYGTVLAFDDGDYSFPPRKGLEVFLDNCEKRGIKVVTSSDAFTGNVRNDLLVAFKLVPEKKLTLDRFDGFFQLDQGIKDFSIIIGQYDIVPKELLVVGDNPNKDIYGALRLRANAIHCPVYGVDEGGEWDFGKIDLDSIKSER